MRRATYVLLLAYLLVDSTGRTYGTYPDLTSCQSAAMSFAAGGTPGLSCRLA